MEIQKGQESSILGINSPQESDFLGKEFIRFLWYQKQESKMLIQESVFWIFERSDSQMGS